MFFLNNCSYIFICMAIHNQNKISKCFKTKMFILLIQFSIYYIFSHKCFKLKLAKSECFYVCLSDFIFYCYYYYYYRFISTQIDLLLLILLTKKNNQLKINMLQIIFHLLYLLFFFTVLRLSNFKNVLFIF
jgi:hypothetical protein